MDRNYHYLAIIFSILPYGGSARADEPVKVEGGVTNASIAKASDEGVTNKKTSDKPPRTYVSLAVGASTGSRGAIICAEVAPLSFLSISGCGNGSGFLHHDAAPDISHWRLNFTPTSFKAKFVWLEPRIQAGFAEVQVGEDTPGFTFSGTNETRTSTSGAELGASLRGRMPLRSGFEMTGELGASVGYFPYGPVLVRPQSAWIPSVAFTLGIGF